MTLNQHFNDFLKDSNNNEHTAMSKMADYVFKNYCLQAGDTPYWFTEIEFYYYSPEHPDPFCKRNPHRAQDTKSPGVASDKLFFHYSGVDISFDSDEADKMKRQYGGILIRGIQNPNEKDAVSGPLKVLCHLLNKTQQTKEGRLTLQLAPSPFTDTYKSIPRYGLSAPAGDEAKQKYIAEPYRFHLSRATGVKQAKTGKK